MMKTLEIEHPCPYCGQMTLIRVDEGTPEAERDERVKMRCGCAKAVRERDLREANDKLEQVCGQTSVDNGFDMPVESEAMDICRRAVEWIYDGLIRDITVRSMQGDKIVIKSDGSNVKIKRTCQKQMQL